MTDPTPPGGAGEALAKSLPNWLKECAAYLLADSGACKYDEEYAEKLREAAALLTEQSRQQEAWQPIETAPKDEDVDVLLYVPGERALSIGHWEPEAYATPGDEDSHIPEGWWGHLLWPVDGPQPTHWMPLPAPPQPKEPR
jgi:hypothetical protein